MAFPGYPLSGGKTNLTSQSTDHPTHHNDLAAAVNDLQSQVDASIPGSKIIDNTITSAKIADGTIVENDLANGSVTSLKMAPAICQVAQTAAQSCAIGDTILSFDVEQFDNVGWHSNAVNPERITPTMSGMVRVSVNWEMQSDDDYTRRLIDIYKNGAYMPDPIIRFEDGPATLSAGQTPCGSLVSPLLYVNGTTDYFTIRIHQQNTNNQSRTMRAVFAVEMVYVL